MADAGNTTTASTPVRTRSRRRRLIVVAAGAVALALVAIVGVYAVQGRSGGPARHPLAKNAIVVIVDDESDFSCANTPKYLPRSSPWLLQQGTCFENAVSPDPVCCPARAQIQTGQRPHNNGVPTQVAATNIDISHTIQYALGQAGIDTYGIGKDLNGIDPAEYYGPNARSTGFRSFDFWKSYHSYDYELYNDQGQTYTPPGPKVNTTVRTGDYLHDYVAEEAGADQPFFAYAAFFAPHRQDYVTDGGSTPKDYPLATPANAHRPVPPFHFEPERHAEDKLHYFQHYHRNTRAYYKGLYTHRVRAVYDVDDQLARLHDQLQSLGILQDTAVIFVSDNGYTDLGQDNWDGKAIPYPAATQVPMLAYLPGRFPAGKVVTQYAELTDIAATLYQIFDVTPNHVLDGHSLLDPAEMPDAWYGEYTTENDSLVRRESGLGSSTLLSWREYATKGDTYVEWYKKDGTLKRSEFYEDPGMTRNLLYRPYHQLPPHALLEKYRTRLRSLKDCKGTVEQHSVHPCL